MAKPVVFAQPVVMLSPRTAIGCLGMSHEALFRSKPGGANVADDGWLAGAIMNVETEDLWPLTCVNICLHGLLPVGIH